MHDIQFKIVKEKIILSLIIIALLGIDGPFFLLCYLIISSQLASHTSSSKMVAPSRGRNNAVTRRISSCR